MKANSFEGMSCSIASVMGVLGDRWGTLVMRDILLGLKRYDALKKSTGITNATLSDRLKTLEANGLIERRLYQTRPERFEYVATAMGRDIALVMFAMLQVGDKWNLAGLEGPPLHLVHQQTGHALKLAVLDAENQQIINPQEITVKLGVGADDLTAWRLQHATGEHLA